MSTLYGYTSMDKLKSMVVSNRKAYVITNIHRGNEGDCIKRILTTLNNLGFNTGLLNQCNILKSGNSRHIVLSVRADTKLSPYEEVMLENIRRQSSNIFRASDFVQAIQTEHKI